MPTTASKPETGKLIDTTAGKNTKANNPIIPIIKAVEIADNFDCCEFAVVFIFLTVCKLGTMFLFDTTNAIVAKTAITPLIKAVVRKTGVPNATASTKTPTAVIEEICIIDDKSLLK